MRVKNPIPKLTVRRILLFVAVALSGFQFYDPGAQSFIPPVCMLAALGLAPDLLRSLRVLLHWPPTLLLAGLLLAYLISLSWSVDLQLGTRTIVYVLMFLAIFAAGLAEARRDPGFVRGLLLWTLAVGLVQIGIIVLFREHPYLKISFFKSYGAGLFINPDSLTALFTIGGANNVLDPTKSGGLLENANVAGAYAGFLAATAFGLAWSYGRRRWFAGACLFLFGAYTTGSKAAILFCGVLALTMVIAIALKGRRAASRGALIGLVLAPILGFLAYMFDLVTVGSSGASFANQTAATFEERTIIWRYAREMFPQTPLLGQGFGGWQLGFTQYAASVGIPANFPPHNLLIYTWSQGGALALVAALGFIAAILRFAARYLPSRDPELFGLSFALTFGLLWMLAQSMGENYSLVGDEHMEPILALLCGFAAARFAAVAPARQPVPPIEAIHAQAV